MDRAEGTSKRRSRPWVVIILVALGLHLVLLLTIKPEFFEVFRKTLVDVDETGAASTRAAPRQAIIVVPVEVESEEADEVDKPFEKPEPMVSSEPQTGTRDEPTVNILDVIGEAQSPIPSTPGSSAAIVPPRPVEITWPETEKLGHCLGRTIDIRIRVGEDGEVLLVEPVDNDHPPDCTQAAIDAAQRIRFRAGSVDGKPKAMWTQIRIEFRKQRR